jgi:hypothetical protein
MSGAEDAPAGPPADAPDDVAPAVLALARAIQRTCIHPGRYTIQLFVPFRPAGALEVVIYRVEVVQRLSRRARRAELKKE